MRHVTCIKSNIATSHATISPWSDCLILSCSVHLSVTSDGNICSKTWAQQTFHAALLPPFLFFFSIMSTRGLALLCVFSSWYLYINISKHSTMSAVLARQFTEQELRSNGASLKADSNKPSEKALSPSEGTDKSRFNIIERSRWPDGIPAVMGAHLMASHNIAPLSTSKGKPMTSWHDKHFPVLWRPS